MKNGTEIDPKRYTLSTEAFAAINGVKPQSVRKRFCETGGYWGIVPRKLANRRLVWPDTQVTV